jgi:hypothetical protein
MSTRSKGPLAEDYKRAMLAAKWAGAKSVRVEIGGSAMVFVLDDSATGQPTSGEQPPALPAPVQPPERVARRLPNNPRGAQAVDIICCLLLNGPASLQQMRDELKAKGYSQHSLGNVLQTFRNDFVRTADGFYALKSPEDVRGEMDKMYGAGAWKP